MIYWDNLEVSKIFHRLLPYMRDTSFGMSFLACLHDFDLNSIGLLQRMLLVTDGTLTDLLQVAFLEPIGVRKLTMEVGKASEPMLPLDLKAGDEQMYRAIVLYGQNTGNNYVYAETIVALDRLLPQIRKDLIDSDKPIGRLWGEYGVETRKEFCDVSRCSQPALRPYFEATAASDGLLRRSYRLVNKGRPVMIITEYFPDRYVAQGIQQAEALPDYFASSAI